jgi:hypothetical protein
MLLTGTISIIMCFCILWDRLKVSYFLKFTKSISVKIRILRLCRRWIQPKELIPIYPCVKTEKKFLLVLHGSLFCVRLDLMIVGTAYSNKGCITMIGILYSTEILQFKKFFF